MSRNFREPRNTYSQLVQRFALITFGFLMLLVVASGVFVYRVSPLRDPSFNDANAGSLIPWLQGVHENTWLQGASVLAGLLATNIVLILQQWRQSITNITPQFSRLTIWTGVGVIFFILFEAMFVGYLLAQWLVD